MDLLLFFIFTDLKMPIFHQIVMKFNDFRDDFKSELNMGDRGISHTLSEGRLLARSDPPFVVGTHSANGGKPLEGEQTTPEWFKSGAGTPLLARGAAVRRAPSLAADEVAREEFIWGSSYLRPEEKKRWGVLHLTL
jgi:hypothetical protein